ncbi:efflux RND transporter periplasmic adaptor subunit [Stenotrophobium rhamnosiphilum]|uniref:Efflux RND transporter periplasmic adaptor subunit n=1 Tax=Stenotrophobium rhamnosiphilum TaxID=2029166 RepID=A0A2T5MKC5_9GAMM|nr:efflux RND transporter periplasmic adaptor subunit [Stenotrophobium rhamnosiphilum]PTU33014.1 efflux RND transporter periplasmic adaptor subunit [Stenotrophobium rhamnosiphilum]
MNDINLEKLRVNRGAHAAPKKRRSSNTRTWIIAGATLAIIVYALLPKPTAIQATQVVSAWPSQQYQVLNATGYVVAQRKAAVAPKGTGRVEWIGVSEGDVVKEGVVLARLESRDVAASYQAASANRQVAEAAVTSAENEMQDADRNLDRTTLLFNKRLLSVLNLQDAKSRKARVAASLKSSQASLAAARANEQLAKTNLDSTQMVAPFDGTVLSRSANVGDIVTPLASAADAKGAVLLIADLNSLEVDADVSESSLAQIKMGQPCEIVLDAYPDRRYRAEVRIIAPTVNRASATVTAKVRFLDRDPDVLPDMSARVAFLSQAVNADQQKPVMAVSPTAIVEGEGGSHVFQIGADGRAHAVAVQVGAVLGGVRAVSGNLKVGDALVLAPGSKMSDGDRIKLADAP